MIFPYEIHIGYGKQPTAAAFVRNVNTAHQSLWQRINLSAYQDNYLFLTKFLYTPAKASKYTYTIVFRGAADEFKALAAVCIPNPRIDHTPTPLAPSFNRVDIQIS